MDAEEPVPELRQRLKHYQIFCIVISSVIGTGVFNGNGTALMLSGPLGLFITVLVLGVITICVGETVSELVQVWAVPNAIYKYVAAFVDKDLAWVVTILYWYAFAAAFAGQILAAARLLEYWDVEPTLPPLVFYGIMPWALLFCNMLWVDFYGWIETVGGFLKGVLIFGVTCVLYNISNEGGLASKSGPIADGFQYKEDRAANTAHAFFYGVPFVAYSFVGIETTVIAAFEAQTSRSMAIPSRTAHFFVFVFYLLCTLGIVLTVDWTDPHLDTRTDMDSFKDFKSNSAVIVAIHSYYTEGTLSGLGGFFNVCLIVSVITAANTSLYISSRTLYGLLYDLNGSNFVTRRLKAMSAVWRSTGVPTRALLFTFIVFYWMPWLNLVKTVGVGDVLKTLSLTSSVSCIIVWASLCLAFIRCERWTSKCKGILKNAGYQRFIRGTPEYERCKDRAVWTALISFQPLVAWIGLLGCIMVFVSSSATWWITPATVDNVASAYGPHMFGFGLWLFLKTYRFTVHRRDFELYVPLAPGKLIDTLEHLEFVSAYAARRGEGRYQRNHDADAASATGSAHAGGGAYGNNLGLHQESHYELTTRRSSPGLTQGFSDQNGYRV